MRQHQTGFVLTGTHFTTPYSACSSIFQPFKCPASFATAAVDLGKGLRFAGGAGVGQIIEIVFHRTVFDVFCFYGVVRRGLSSMMPFLDVFGSQLRQAWAGSWLCSRLCRFRPDQLDLLGLEVMSARRDLSENRNSFRHDLSSTAVDRSMLCQQSTTGIAFARALTLIRGLWGARG